MNKRFTYLGKDFNMHMSNDYIKSQLVSTIEKHLQITDQLPLHPLQKIEICQRFISSELKWQFSIYNLNETWVAETLAETLKVLPQMAPNSSIRKHITSVPTSQ